MDNKLCVKDILKDLKSNDYVIHCGMPLGYVEGLPTLQIKNDQLCLQIPFLRYQLTGQVDKTLVYPIRFVLTISLPERNLVSYCDLSFNSRFRNVDFSAPVGLFRHEAIKNLTKNEYRKMREELLEQYDKVADSLLNGTQYTAEDEEKMRRLLNTLIEPSLLPIYKVLDEDFYNKYLA